MKTPTYAQTKYQEYRKNRGTFFLFSVMNGTEEENWAELTQFGKIIRFPRILIKSLIECGLVKIDESSKIISWVGKFCNHPSFEEIYDVLNRTTTYINLDHWKGVELVIQERHQ